MFFTIITATRNAAATLPRLLDSLACQTCRDFELIIQDGASTDGTVGLAEAYRDRLPALSLDSAPDRGIYDAWNKALGRIQGEWVLFLGADDELASHDTLEQCRAVFVTLPPTILYAGGGVDFVSRHTDEIVGHKPYFVDKATEQIQMGNMPFPHPALWHRQALFDKNHFDDSLSIVADYDFICRTWTKENGNAVLPFTVTRMRRGGVSDSPQHTLRIHWEIACVASRYFKGAWTASRILCLLKGCLIWLSYKLIGPEKTPRLLDVTRRLRGLPPLWKGL
ncbi:MAG: glycosyltransferase [Desulfovibrio sp.]|jgi:glycosyltransferase involved in cell wall biosynthesis|nr:glycosyltransferase [Desulfovibrio sp.]